MEKGQGQLVLQSGLPNSGSENGVLLSVNVQKMGFTSPVASVELLPVSSVEM